MRAWLSAAWQLLRELSGEAALERRMAQCSCEGPEAVKAAWQAAFGGIHRCC
jgi:hypothetical protein